MPRDLYLVVKPGSGDDEAEFDVISSGGGDDWTARFLADDVVLFSVDELLKAVTDARLR